MKNKEGIQSLFPSHKPNISNDSSINGKVYGVITNQNTPTKELFEKYGGWSGLGTIFYLDYDQSKDSTHVDLEKCDTAKPLFPNQKYYPLIGEIVILTTAPSSASQVNGAASEKYYITTVNLWSNPQHNSLPTSAETSLGKTFQEKININTLQPFEGDYILESRFGSGIRFTSTVRDPNVDNYWSENGDEGNPITLITNGYNFDPSSTSPYLEDLNNDASSIIISSTQTIPLLTDKINLNVLTNPISIDKYNAPQIILNSDRLVLNAKKDDVFVVAKKNIELYTRHIININSGDRIHLNSPKTFIGTKVNGDLPDEPLLLGDKTVELIDSALQEIINFANSLTSAVASPQGTPLLQINQAAQLLSTKLEALIKISDDIKSKNNYTI